MNTETLTLSDLDAGELCTLWLAHHETIQAAATHRTLVEAEFLHRLRESGGTEIPDARIEVTLKQASPTYDYGTLTPLKELVPEADPTAFDKAYIAEHYEMVPEQWNGTQLNKLERTHGPESPIGRIIGQARIPGSEALRVRVKKQAEAPTK
jgi:hypothetical protein